MKSPKIIKYDLEHFPLCDQIECYYSIGSKRGRYFLQSDRTVLLIIEEIVRNKVLI